jgi:hypothetical protein
LRNTAIAYFALILLAASVFFLLIPGIGAFLTRARWRRFRRLVQESSRYPFARPEALDASTGEGGSLGWYRFFGSLEAIQGNDRIWITDGNLSVAAEMRDAMVHLLPVETAEEESKEPELEVLPWNRIFSLPEGTSILVAGEMRREGGRAVFKPRRETPLLAVIYEGDKRGIMRRAIWGGRQHFEYWNQFTIPSLITGSFSLIVLTYLMLRDPDLRGMALFALTLSLSPITPFLPPGFPLSFVFRSFWRRARLMRAQRDVLRLPLRFFPRNDGAFQGPLATLLPDLEPYLMVQGRCGAGDERFLPGDAETERLPGMRFLLPTDVERLEITLPNRLRKVRDPEEFFLFGAYVVEGDSIRIQAPEDPMAELLLIPGNPTILSDECSRTARFYERISFLTIACSIAVNLFALFLILNRLAG